jgi:hypothetical protein
VRRRRSKASASTLSSQRAVEVELAARDRGARGGEPIGQLGRAEGALAGERVPVLVAVVAEPAEVEVAVPPGQGDPQGTFSQLDVAHGPEGRPI